MKTLTLIPILFALLLNATGVAAGDTDPQGTALRAYVEHYLAAAPATDALAAKINAAGGADGAGVNEWLCSLEVTNTFSTGYRIWEARMQADAFYLSRFSKTQFIPLNITNYCINYSNNCGHWAWTPDCLEHRFIR